MIATATPLLLAAGMIEISGLPAILVLLAPFVVLVLVIVGMRRAPKPSPQSKSETLRAIPAVARAATASDAEPVVERPQPIDWAQRIRSAEASNDQAALGQLYLSFAHAEFAKGHRDAAAEHLRASLRAATKSRNKSVQAEARLELADLARETGDLTTACEHWQLARALFHDLKREPERDSTEKLMLKHGCPTDWVLNDF